MGVGRSRSYTEEGAAEDSARNNRRISNRTNLRGRMSSSGEERGTRLHSGDEDEDQDGAVYRILQQLLRSGQVRLITEDNIHGTNGSSSCSEDDEEQLSLRQALDSTDNLMMGPTRRTATQSRAIDTSCIQENDLMKELLRNCGENGETSRFYRPAHIPGRLVCREMGMPCGGLKNIHRSSQATFTSGDKCYISRKYLPNRKRVIAKHRTKTFCSQFSSNGDFLLTASQDHSLRFYRRSGNNYSFWKELVAKDVGWSILDVALSPDGRHVIYGTWSDFVHEFKIDGEEERYEAYNLQSPDYRFCVFSLRYSRDGSEILAGASDKCLYVYSREEKRRLLKIDAHEDDINAVCFGDEASNMIYSGGDDGLVKVWDRRQLSESQPAPVGILAGHMDGITFIDSKGDGRYLLSNSKDQSIKLWDIRKFSGNSAQEATREAVSRQHWDYRWQAVPKKARKFRKLDGDSSVMTYRGHTVLHTLIRAYFSPQFSTGQRYIYCGSARGNCCVYDILTGELVRKLDGHHSCVRDVTWHPYDTEIVTSSWDGTTAAWRYDERRARNINPEPENGNESVGDEDTSDEDGRHWTPAALRRKKDLCRRKRRREATIGVTTRGMLARRLNASDDTLHLSLSPVNPNNLAGEVVTVGRWEASDMGPSDTEDVEIPDESVPEDEEDLR